MWQAPGSSPGDAPSQTQEARDLKDQFEQQQTLIAQLKEMLRKNEQQLVNKEKEVEEYATKLSNIKSRTKAKRVPKAGESPDTEKSQPETPDLDTPKRDVKEREETKTTPGRTRQGNLVLLRKKLEEQRMMFEQRGKENESKKGIKEMVEQLKAQLDERDVTIQELQKGFQAHPSPMKTVVSSQPVTQPPIESVLEQSQLQQQEMYAQMIYKDNKILELNNKILELETKVLDLQENLREKDEVIDVRTKAISLMSEDFSRKGKSTLDTLDETREEMRVMQQNFVELETKMKAEKEEMLKQIEAKDCRVLQLEESNKNLESVRFELSTRNAELQEKVVRLQERETTNEDKEQVQELINQLDEANKQLIKQKALHKNKVKNLSKQIDSLKKVSDANEEIVRLQNRIAELEEDKGNLQLHLVDFDDLKVSESHWKKRVSELEERVKQQGQDLDTHVHMISLLEGEKIELLQGIQNEREKIASLENEITELKASVFEVSNQKVSLEMKIVELEEQLDCFAQEKKNLYEELNLVKEELAQKPELVKEIEEKTSVTQEEQDLSAAKDRDMLNLQESLKQVQIELQDARQKLKAQEETISEFQEKEIVVPVVQEQSTQAEEHLEDKLEEMHQKNLEKEALLVLMRDMEAKLQEANTKTAELTSLQEQHTYMQECNIEKIKALEIELSISKVTISELIEQQKHLDSLRDTDSQAIKQLDAKLKEMQKMCEEQREIILDLNMKLAAREEEAEMQKEVIAQLEQLGASGEKEEEERSSKISEIVKELNEMAGDLEEWKHRCSEVEDRLEILGTEKGELQSRFEEVRNENQDLARKLQERDERIAALQVLVDETGRKLQAREESLEKVRSKLGELEHQYKMKYSKLEEELQARDELIQNLQIDLSAEAEKNASEQMQLKYAQDQLHEYENIASQLRNRIDEAETEYNKVLEEMSQRDTVHLQELNALRSELAKFESGRGETQHLESQLKSVLVELQSRDEELHALKQDLTAKSLELERKVTELQEKDTKMKELTEKNKKLIANLKVKALNLKGQEEKLQKYEEIIQAKEAKFDEVVNDREKFKKLLQQSSNESAKVNSLTDELRDQTERVAMLIGELAEERTKTEQLGEELSRATEKIVNLEMELKVSQTNITEASLLKESNSALANKVSQLEREIGIFQMDLRNRDSEVILLKEEVRIKNEDQQQLHSLLEQKEQTVSELQQRLKGAIKSEIELESNLRANTELTTKSVEENVNENIHLLQQELMSRSACITELQERIGSMSENHKQTCSAMEAKLQEKEAVLESLEQELAKSRQQVQHLEDGLANVEERRRSLESKAETLGLRLEESNRVKEEVVETESMLEQRLAELLRTENLLKKKLEALQSANEELNQKVEELKIENIALKRELTNVESALRTTQREVEQLSPLEASLAAERERIEALEAELKRAALEAEHRQREKVAEVKQYAESLETDLRNFGMQLEQAESDRRGLMERCEKLNDEKLNLEDEVENLGQVVEVYKANVAQLDGKNSQLEKTVTDKELALKDLTQKLKQEEITCRELKEQVTLLQNELQIKSTALSEKNVEMEQLKKELKERTNWSNETLERMSNEKKEFEDMIQNLEEEFRKASSEKEMMRKDFEERIKYLEKQLQDQKNMLETVSLTTEKRSVSLETEEAALLDDGGPENQTIQLIAELETLKGILKQRDAEIKSYQTRLLQLQFGSGDQTRFQLQFGDGDSSQERVLYLEEQNNNLKEAIKAKDIYISELGTTVNARNAELGKLMQQIAEYQSTIAELTKELEVASSMPVVTEYQSRIAELTKELEETRSKPPVTLPTPSVAEYQSRIAELTKELEEIQSKTSVTLPAPNVAEYQSRIAELTKELEEIRSKTPVTFPTPNVAEYQSRIAELTKELEKTQSKTPVTLPTQDVTLYQSRIAELTKELEETQSKIPVTLPTPDVTLLLSELEEKMALLKNEKEDLYLDLITEKAKQEVSLIVKLAENCINAMSESKVKEVSARTSSVMFQDSKESSPDSMQTSELALELEEQLKAVITELNLVKAERDEALLRITVLETAVPHPLEAVPRLETSDTILMLERVPSQDIEIVPIVVDHPSTPVKELMEASGFTEVTQGVAEENVLKVSSEWAEEEGWAWGSDEAKLEEEHIQKQQLVAQMMSTPSDDLRVQVRVLEDHIKDLELEKEKLNEELQAAQIRAGKMLKKLKDLKLKNESLMKENLELAKQREERHFTDLDQAIEEELKIRIDTLEKEIKDIRTENDSLRTEKEALAKRADVLTSANERFVEMKERQDMENEVWQQRNRELQNQIEALEWRISELMEERPLAETTSRDDRKTPANAFFSWDKQVTAASASNNELQEHLTALAADNENLQSLLEEQRNLRLAAEAGLQNLKHAQNKTQVETSQAANRLAAENQALRDSYEVALNELQQLHSASETSKALQEETALLRQECNRLNVELTALQEGNTLSTLNTELLTLQEENVLLKQECNRLNSELVALQETYHTLRTEHGQVSEYFEAQIQVTALADLKRKIEELNTKNLQLELLYQKVLKEHDLLSEHVQGSQTMIQQLRDSNENLVLQCNELNENLSLANMQKLNLEHEVLTLRSQLETATFNSHGPDRETIWRDEVDRELRVKSKEIESLRQNVETLHLQHAQAEGEWIAKTERLRKDLDTSNEDLLRERNCHSILAKEHQELQAEVSTRLFEIEGNFAEALSMKEKDLEMLRIQLAERESSKVNEKTEDNMQHKLLEKEQEVAKLLDVRDRLKLQLVEMEDRLTVKATDAENLRLQLAQVEKTLQEQVGQRDKDIRNLQQQLAERNMRAHELQHMVDEETQQLSELRELLEDRESAIHKLKDQLRNRKDSSVTSLDKSSEEQKEDESSDIQQKQSELDLALYMLHQRDVRIDELTLELMQLLEERDTLQLRLSNALRLNEELRARTRISASASPVKVPTSSPSSSTNRNDQIIATLANEPGVVQAVISDRQENLEALANKISQLRSVGYQRDVTLKDEREQRHTGQMHLLQQRGSGVVVDATYTLSARDVQSPSTVLLNWLWGRSTPKVMHI